MNPNGDAATYLGWDIASWSPALAMWTDALAQVPPGHAIEIGAREGRLSLWLARQGFTVDCTDITDTSELARAFHLSVEPDADVLARISYKQLDATAEIPEEVYDVAVFKSVLGGIGGVHGRSGIDRAIKNIRHALLPGGHLLFGENLAASRLLGWTRRTFTNWGATWLYPTERELRDALSCFREVDVETAGLIAALGRRESQRYALARFDTRAIAYAPHHWRYLAFGHAKK